MLFFGSWFCWLLCAINLYSGLQTLSLGKGDDDEGNVDGVIYLIGLKVELELLVYGKCLSGNCAGGSGKMAGDADWDKWASDPDGIPFTFANAIVFQTKPKAISFK